MASKSLGTLTLDLIAKIGGFTGPMDKAARNTKKNSKSMSDALISVGKASALMAVAAGGALALMTIKAAQAEDAIKDLAAASGIAINDFKALSYAFGTVGISAEQLSEMSRKAVTSLGKFMQTGKGGFADVFEVLAGKVDLTADSLRGLTGPEVLQKVKDAMDQANVPIEQQGFLLDKVVKGAGKLIPLFADQGAALNEMTDKFNKYNESLLLSTEASDDLGDIADDFDLLKVTMENATKYLAAEFAPELKKAINWALENVPKAVSAMESFFGQFRDVEDISSVNVLLEKQAKNIETIAAMQAKVQNGTAGTRVYDTLEAALLENSAIEYKLDLLKQQEQVQKAVVAAALPTTIDTASAKVAQKEAIKLQKEAAAELVKFHEWQIKQADDELDLIYELDDARRESLQKQKDEFNARREEAADWLNVLENENATELQLIAQHEQDKLDIAEAYYMDGSLSREQYQNALTEIDKAAAAEREQFELARQQLLFTSGEQFFGAMADMAKTFGGEQSTFYKVMFAAQKAAAIASSIVAIQQGIAQAASLTFPANIGAMATVAGATAGLVSTIASTNIQGMAHDGIDSVPQTGTWLLQKGERVTTAATSAKLDRTLSNMGSGGDVTIVNQTTGRVDNVEKQTMDDGRLVIIIQEVMNAELNNPNSRTNKTLTRTRQAPRKF